MKRYDIKVFINRDNNDICMIFSTSYLSPLKFVADIENELSHMYNQGIEVIFDFFLSSGNNSERFAKAYFDGRSFVKSSFEYIKVEKNADLRKLSVQYYKNSKEELDFAFLNNVQKKMILSEIAI